MEKRIVRWLGIVVLALVMVLSVAVATESSATSENGKSFANCEKTFTNLEEWRIHPGLPEWSGSNPPELNSYCAGINNARVTLWRNGKKIFTGNTKSAGSDHWAPMCPGFETSDAVKNAAYAGWVSLPPTRAGDVVKVTYNGKVTKFTVPSWYFSMDIFVPTE